MPQTIIHELVRDPALIHSRESAGFKDPVVSFCCPTFGTVARRPELLQEVVYWYRRQTYPHRELLILNDAPGQKIHVSGLLQAEGVRIVNFPYRIPTLGDKRNLLTMMAIGAVILPQDDDDISLPWRAAQAVKKLDSWDYWTPKCWWYYEVGAGRVRADSNGVGHNCSAYRRAAMYNRYPECSGSEDKKVHEWAMRGGCRVNPEGLKNDDDISYVYRWGVNDRHISGYESCGVDMQDAYDTFDPGPDGDYELVDKMGLDWVAVHNTAVDVPT